MMPEYTKVFVNKNSLISVQESINIGRQMFQRKLAVYQEKVCQFEKTNNMDTTTFSKLFNKGELGDKKEWLQWDHYVCVVNLLEKKLTDLDGIQYES